MKADTHGDQLVWIEGLDAYLRGDCESALKILKPLAVEGNAEAQNLIGHIYLYGNGVEKDIVKAEKWLATAAAGGLPVAQASLDDMERDGLCQPCAQV